MNLACGAAAAVNVTEEPGAIAALQVVAPLPHDSPLPVT